MTPFRFKSCHPATGSLPGHRHQSAYIALIEAGTYVEYSADGLYQCNSGMAVVHPAFHLHGNSFTRQLVQIINISLPFGVNYQVFSLNAHHFKRALNTQNAEDLLALVQTEGLEKPPQWCPSVVRTMADSLRSHPNQRIHELARSLNVSLEHAARQFKRYSGMTPVNYRSEYRLRYALTDLLDGQHPVDVAVQRGFSDQSHLCRAVKAATTWTITDLQTSDLFKTLLSH